MKVHCCLVDPQCRQHGAPPRLHFSMKRGNLGIALWPSGKFVGKVGDENTYWTNWTPANKGS